MMQTAFQKIKQALATALIFSLLLASVCLPVSAEDENLQVMTLSGDLTDGTVRVFLSSIKNPAQLNLTVDGSYSLNGTAATAIARGTRLVVNFSASSGTLTLTKGGIMQDMGEGFRLYRHQTTGDNGIRIAEAETTNLYPGDLEFVVKKTTNGYKLYTIVHVFIEDYLYGVLPYEMGSSAPLEALKAQCVAARNYVLRAMNSANTNIYDVVDTTNDQVYRGMPTGSERCKQAVDETRGLISMYGATFTGTYYTASNGGQIDSISNVWGSANYDYIRVKDDPYDLQNSASRVNTVNVEASGNLNNQTLRSLLEAKARTQFNAASATITAIHSVLPHTPRYPIHSRLYTKLDFEVTANCDGVSRHGTLTFDIFTELESRLTMSINGDNNELWSVKPTANGFAIQSRRFGHGTGLSQRGAMKMAEEGYTFEEILAFYFEGCVLKGQTFVKSIRAELSAGGAEVITQVAPAAVGASAAYAVVEMSGIGSQLALRTAPNAGADVIMGIPHSAVVSVHAVSGDYALVTFGETSGYAHTGAMKISGRPDGAAKTIATLESYGKVNNNDYLNLRAGAGTSHTVLAEIPTGTVLPLFDINNGWAYTQYGRESGYVSMDYITRSDHYQGSAHDGDATGAEVIAVGGVPMRATPSTMAYSPMVLPEGVIVKVKHDDGSWSEVYYAGVTGFVPSIMLRANGIAVEEPADKPGSGEMYAQVASESTSLNMRQAASLSATVMIEIPRNETVIVTKVQGDWCAVRYRGMNGYCAKEYLTLDVSGEQDPGAETLTARVTTESGSLNMRKSASKNATIIKTIPRNTVITVLERGATWSKVTYGGKTGFVMNDYLTFGESEALPDTPGVTPPASGTTYKKAKVVTAEGKLNLRKKASAGATILKQIPRHAIIDVLEINGTWTKVTYKNETGYVMSAFLQYLEDGAVETPPADTPSVTPPAADNANKYARVTTASGSLNMRKKASSSAGIIRTIPRNTVIEVLSKGDKWSKVTYKDDTGYVMSSFLTFMDAPEAAPPAADNNTSSGAQQMAQVTTKKGSLNLRKRASSSATILTTIPQYAYIQVISKDGSWVKVTYGGYTGYVKKEFLTYVSGTVAPGVPDSPSDEGETPWARVTTEKGSLNLRAKASGSAKIMDTIPRHAIIPVVEKGSVWTKVTYDGQTGYVKNSFLTFLKTHPDGITAPGGSAAVQPNDMLDDTLITLGDLKTAQVLPAGASAKLRKGCSESADEMATILRGEYIVVSAQGQTWCRVEYEGMTGYLPTEILGL